MVATIKLTPEGGHVASVTSRKGHALLGSMLLSQAVQNGCRGDVRCIGTVYNMRSLPAPRYYIRCGHAKFSAKCHRYYVIAAIAYYTNYSHAIINTQLYLSYNIKYT